MYMRARRRRDGGSIHACSEPPRPLLAVAKEESCRPSMLPHASWPRFAIWPRRSGEACVTCRSGLTAFLIHSASAGCNFVRRHGLAQLLTPIEPSQATAPIRRRDARRRPPRRRCDSVYRSPNRERSSRPNSAQDYRGGKRLGPDRGPPRRRPPGESRREERESSAPIER